MTVIAVRSHTWCDSRWCMTSIPSQEHSCTNLKTRGHRCTTAASHTWPKPKHHPADPRPLSDPIALNGLKHLSGGIDAGPVLQINDSCCTVVQYQHAACPRPTPAANAPCSSLARRVTPAGNQSHYTKHSSASAATFVPNCRCLDKGRQAEHVQTESPYKIQAARPCTDTALTFHTHRTTAEAVHMLPPLLTPPLTGPQAEPSPCPYSTLPQPALPAPQPRLQAVPSPQQCHTLRGACPELCCGVPCS